MALDDMDVLAVADNGSDEFLLAEIARKAGLKKPTNVDALGLSPETADTVANYTHGKPAVILSKYHSAVARVHNTPDVVLVVFDRHVNYHPASGFSDLNFLGERKGPVYVIGTNEPSPDQRIKVFPPNMEGAERIYDEPFLDTHDGDKRKENKPKIFLSLDVGVFGPATTTAHSSSRATLGERVKALGDRAGLTSFKTHLTPEDIKGLSLSLLAGRELVGLNIAGYNSFFDMPKYHTQDMLADYIRFVLNRRL